MPLVRKPGVAPPPTAPNAARVLASLTSPDANERWSAARAAAAITASETNLAQALSVEADAGVRAAILTSLAQIGTPTSIEPLISMVRSQDAAARTAALDALRLTPLLPRITAQLVQDPDAHVRLLGCDLARTLPVADSNLMFADLLEREAQPNVCAAAVEVLAEVGGPMVLGALASCAKRFPENEFLLFAIKTVVERINATAVRTRV